MPYRLLVASLSLVVFVVVAPAAAAGQEADGWTMPRTPWGDPDLMGTYTNRTITPLQRPEELADQEFLSAEEVERLERERRQLNEQEQHAPPRATVGGGSVGSYNGFWRDRGTRPTGRTSLIFDPPDGRIPPVTPEYERHAARRAEDRLTRGEADTWRDLQLNDRCIVWSAGPPMLPGPYNNTYMIFQTPDYIAIQVEMIHDARIIPLDGRPHLTSKIRQYLGDMRGHWEGDTLVVETTNIQRTEDAPGVTGGAPLAVRASNGRTDDTIRIVERFTRVADDTINYQFTIEDPSRWTRSFSGEFPFVMIEEDLYEYACHEGNYSIPNILSGARAEE